MVPPDVWHRLQRLSAMRPGEMCELKPADIDRSGEVWFYEPTQHKSKWRGKARRVVLGPQAQEVLRPYLLRGADNHCFDSCESRVGAELKSISSERPR